MSYRGLFEGIFDKLGLEWDWNIQLLEVDVVPVSTLLRSREDRAALRGLVIEHLRAQRRKHEAFSNRHFVYFVARRPRVKFASMRPARLRADRVDLRVHVGNSWLPRAVPAPLWCRVVGDVVRDPTAAEVSNDALRFHYDGGHTATTTLFDYLVTLDIDLGLNTTIEYVGITATPEERPTNLEHRGLLEAVHGTNPALEEVFVLFNTFHVRSSAAVPQLAIQTSNSLTDQLKIRPEAEYIEKLLIDYFEPAQQRCSLANERSILRRLERDLKSCRVRTVELTYEVEAMSDVYRIGSAKIPAARAHTIQRPTIDLPRPSHT